MAQRSPSKVRRRRSRRTKITGRKTKRGRRKTAGEGRTEEGKVQEKRIKIVAQVCRVAISRFLSKGGRGLYLSGTF